MGKRNVLAALLLNGLTMAAVGQAAKPAVNAAQAPASPAPAAQAPAAAKPAPLQLQTLGQQTQADPFPLAERANFTAESPTPGAVDLYLKAMLGYDPARIWRVEGIQKTPAAGVSKVTTLVSERTPNAKVLTAVFYVLPDGQHLLADGSGVMNFGANPFAADNQRLREQADGPARGAAGKDLMLVEFADLQCPGCKKAAPLMDQLQKDFPRARVVYENYPLTQLHPYAFKAASYGVCVDKAGDPAFFTFAQAVYDTQSALTAQTADATLAAAVTKAGGDPAAVAACAATAATKARVDASIKLARELNIGETPSLAINGRVVPLSNIPYETLKQIIAFQASLDGVQGAAAPALK